MPGSGSRFSEFSVSGPEKLIKNGKKVEREEKNSPGSMSLAKRTGTKCAYVKVVLRVLLT